MGRLLILLLIIVVIVLVWRGFGPGTWNRGGDSGTGGGIGGRRRVTGPEPRRPIGPDDDEDFLWKLDKQRFEEQRAREREERRAAEERRAREEGPRPGPGDQGDGRGRDGGDGPDPAP